MLDFSKLDVCLSPVGAWLTLGGMISHKPVLTPFAGHCFVAVVAVCNLDVCFLVAYGCTLRSHGLPNVPRPHGLLQPQANLGIYLLTVVMLLLW
jgi:hypothetical protein